MTSMVVLACLMFWSGIDYFFDEDSTPQKIVNFLIRWALVPFLALLLIGTVILVVIQIVVSCL